jgi:hypothetical protein
MLSLNATFSMALKRLFFASLLCATAFAGCDGQNNSRPKSLDNKEKAKALPAGSDSSAQLMKQDDFWKLIDKSRATANNNYQAQTGSLKKILLTLEAKEIEKFDNTFTALLAASYDWKLWGAAYVINGGCSDDCFDYFRQYLIGHGKDKFYQTLKDPERCVTWVKSEDEDNWEGLQYAAMDAYKEKTGNGLPKSYQPKFELKGKPFDEETVFKQYPRLAKKFMSDN